TPSLNLFATFFPRRPLQFFANFGAFADFLHWFTHHDWNRTRSSNRPHIPRHFGSSKPLKLPRENESQVCHPTRTLRSCLRSRQNTRQEFFPARIVEPRAMHFYGQRKHRTSSREHGTRHFARHGRPSRVAT